LRSSLGSVLPRLFFVFFGHGDLRQSSSPQGEWCPVIDYEFFNPESLSQISKKNLKI